MISFGSTSLTLWCGVVNLIVLHLFSPGVSRALSELRFVASTSDRHLSEEFDNCFGFHRGETGS